MTSTNIVEISRLDLQELSTPSSASITSVEHLSSYNWIEAPTPTIAIPGCPPLWTAPKAPRRVKKDSGLVYIAQNAARHPESPLEPLFRALYLVNPSYDIRSIDVVTDRNNIRKLLSFINPSSTQSRLETFTINIEVTKNTAIFCRHETATYDVIGPHEFKGFGHEFEKATTASQISGSTGHHRIISYRFGDLNFIVRYETDGYVRSDLNAKIPSSASKEQGTESLSRMLGSLSLSSTDNPPVITPTGSKLTIRKEGRVVPLESTLEIKTRVSHKPLQFQEIVPQLWVSQTPKLVRAYHNKGTFQPAVVEDVAAQIKKWEESNRNDLRKLAALISRIVSVVKDCGGRGVVRYDDKADKLVVRQVDGKAMLPEDLYSKWDDEEKAEETGAERTETSVENVEAKEGEKSTETKADVRARRPTKSLD
ncbi:hypothetical protein EG329_012002 [Mollisiaceae sp. DMI_Dod_QoI]|nr:hypothetical protein EG329_012002 [Helotiales sp. DMI_Dod_QoI]